MSKILREKAGVPVRHKGLHLAHRPLKEAALAFVAHQSARARLRYTVTWANEPQRPKLTGCATCLTANFYDGSCVESFRKSPCGTVPQVCSPANCVLQPSRITSLLKRFCTNIYLSLASGACGSGVRRRRKRPALPRTRIALQRGSSSRRSQSSRPSNTNRHLAALTRIRTARICQTLVQLRLEKPRQETPNFDCRGYLSFSLTV